MAACRIYQWHGERGWYQQNVAAKASTGRSQVIINFSIISYTPTPHPSAFDFFGI